MHGWLLQRSVHTRYCLSLQGRLLMGNFSRVRESRGRALFPWVVFVNFSGANSCMRRRAKAKHLLTCNNRSRQQPESVRGILFPYFPLTYVWCLWKAPSTSLYDQPRFGRIVRHTWYYGLRGARWARWRQLVRGALCRRLIEITKTLVHDYVGGFLFIVNRRNTLHTTLALYTYVKKLKLNVPDVIPVRESKMHFFSLEIYVPGTPDQW